MLKNQTQKPVLIASIAILFVLCFSLVFTVGATVIYDVSGLNLNDITNDIIETTAISSYTLQYNKVQDSSGNWVVSGGNYYGEWELYNCYAYAIHRYDDQSTFNRNTYHPGQISGTGTIDDCTNVYELSDLIRSDLTTLGFKNISVSYSIPTINSSQELICVRMNIKDDGSHIYHFMRYDLETDAWYHKPDTSAVLKFNSVPSIYDVWYEEKSEWGIESLTNNVYDGPIAFIKYSKNQINVSQSSSTRIDIQSGQEVFYEIDINNLGDYDVILSSSSAFEYVIYHEDMGGFISDAGIFGSLFADNVIIGMHGKYFLVLRFDSPNVSGYVDVEICPHIHSYGSYQYKDYRTHSRFCKCGVATQTEGHYVDKDSIINERYANCLGCGALLDLNSDVAQLQSLPGIQFSINGSYLLPSGIAILVDEDIEAYVNGTLQFYSKDDIPVVQ